MYKYLKKELNSDIEQIMIMLSNAKDIKQYEYLNLVLDKINAASTPTLSSFKGNISFDNRLYETCDSYVNYRRYYEYLINVLSIFEKDELELKNSSELAIQTKYEYKYISNEEAFTLVHDFYMSTDSVFSKLFSKYINEKYCKIKFVKQDDTIELDDCAGFNLFVGPLNKNYILIDDILGEINSITLAHECGHALTGLYNPNAYYNCNEIALDELASIFFELAFSYDTFKDNKIIDLCTFLTNIINTIDSIKNFSIHEKVYDVLNNNEYKIDDNFYNELSCFHNLDKKQIKESFDSKIYIDGVYSLSFVLALYLFNIYKQDKKEALILLRKIINDYNNNSLLTMRKFITSFDYIEDEINEFKKIFKKEIKKY